MRNRANQGAITMLFILILVVAVLVRCGAL